MKSLNVNVCLHLKTKQNKTEEQESAHISQTVKQMFPMGCAKETIKMPKSISLAFQQKYCGTQ